MFILGQTESFTIPFQVIAAREIQYNSSLKQNYLVSDGEDLNNMLRTKFSEYYIDIYNKYDIPGLKYDHIPYLIDTDHCSKYGADLTAKKIISNSKVMSLISE